ncbi:uncharacterized protein isoform X2 [Castor canadensis]|uniref:Uncharacterized protein isoform X2 n=1 Tax=Castor canadensis TaxID=51338 RepID=A0AC58L3D9_CASCN
MDSTGLASAAAAHMSGHWGPQDLSSRRAVHPGVCFGRSPSRRLHSWVLARSSMVHPISRTCRWNWMWAGDDPGRQRSPAAQAEPPEPSLTLARPSPIHSSSHPLNAPSTQQPVPRPKSAAPLAPLGPSHPGMFIPAPAGTSRG